MLLFLSSSAYVYNQKLSEFYKKDVIQLEQQSDFARNTNWQELFRDYDSFDSLGGYLGQRKKIIVAPDGSVFMSHKSLHEIWKFDNNGKLVTKFGKKGGKPGEFVYLPNVEGILDGKYVFTSDVQGRLNFFDLNGKFVKLLKLDYVPSAIIPLSNQKIAVLGGVPWKGSQSKNILRIKDFNTGVEKEIWYEFQSYNIKTAKAVIKFPRGGIMSYSIPYSHPMALRFRLATSKNGNLIIASPKTGEVKEYSPEGLLLNTFNLNITPVKITDEDIKEQYDKALQRSIEFEKRILSNIKRENHDSIHWSNEWTDAEIKETIDSYKKQIENFKDRKFYPEHLPYFSSMIVDSDGNLLVFEYTNSEDAQNNKFRAYAYDMKGNYLGTSSFKNDLFDLSFTSSTFQFYKGSVYAVAKGKDKLSPPQIVKMNLK